MLARLAIIGGGYAAALVLGALYLNAHGQLSSQVKSCNAEKEAAVAAAKALVKDQEMLALEEEMRELERRLENETKAREMAAAAAEAAAQTPERVRTIIREVASDTNCLLEPVPDRVINGLRD